MSLMLFKKCIPPESRIVQFFHFFLQNSGKKIRQIFKNLSNEENLTEINKKKCLTGFKTYGQFGLYIIVIVNNMSHDDLKFEI